MGDVIRGRFPDRRHAHNVVPIRQPRPEPIPVPQVRAVQAAPLPDLCTRCGAALTGDSPPEGKRCQSCSQLNSHASLSADY